MDIYLFIYLFVPNDYTYKYNYVYVYIYTAYNHTLHGKPCKGKLVTAVRRLGYITINLTLTKQY